MNKIGRRERKLHADSTQRDVLFFRERERERIVNVEKTDRLRALRMAKEAAERETAEREATEKAALPKRVRKRAH
ncbi:MAG: hypothetical protein EXR11_11465 [Rhodospirillaceae bacterium]|nr:hypothetical protein [Rhodospirillaceae bacterium]